METVGSLGFANLPNQVHRKYVKKGFSFTLMVVGESGLGKTTLINSLFNIDLNTDRTVPTAKEKMNRTAELTLHSKDIEEKGVKLHLTVIDTPGFGDALDCECDTSRIVRYIDEQFKKYLDDESGLNRRNIVDTRVHCCFYFVNPSNNGLKPADVEFLKAVQHKVNLVPIIAKSDTLTKSEITKLKTRILEDIAAHQVQIYVPPDCDDDEDDAYKEHCKQLKEAAPFAVCGSNQILEVRGKKLRGRAYPWGVVEIENADHCDFIRLRSMLITHMHDMQDMTHQILYENFRSEQLSAPNGDHKPAGTPAKQQNRQSKMPDERLLSKELAEKEAELRRMKDMLAKMQLQMQSQADVAPGATALV